MNTVDELPDKISKWRRVYLCFRDYRAWRLRRKIDSAVVAMLDQGVEIETAYHLKTISDRLWDDFWKQNNCR